MKGSEARTAILVVAQRMLSTNQVQEYVNRVRSLGVTDEQMMAYCHPYIINNSDVGEIEEVDPLDCGGSYYDQN